jgi:hypothetical protein
MVHSFNDSLLTVSDRLLTVNDSLSTLPDRPLAVPVQLLTVIGRPLTVHADGLQELCLVISTSRYDPQCTHCSLDRHPLMIRCQPS